eukprot:1104698-Prorocentrum_minimum.AAC.2
MLFRGLSGTSWDGDMDDVCVIMGVVLGGSGLGWLGTGNPHPGWAGGAGSGIQPRRSRRRAGWSGTSRGQRRNPSRTREEWAAMFGPCLLFCPCSAGAACSPGVLVKSQTDDVRGRVETC